MNDVILPQPGDWREKQDWYTGPTLVFRLAKFALIQLTRFLCEIQTEGYDLMPANGPLILAANHLTSFDVIFMSTTLPRHPSYMAKMELFRSTLWRWLLRQLSSFPVNRGEVDSWAVRHAGIVLEENAVLGMFPEGARSKTTPQLRPGKAGAVRLAMAHHVPIVPLGIFGTERFLKDGWGYKRYKIGLKMGAPIDFATQLQPDAPVDHKKLRELTNSLMTSIAALLPPEYRGVYS